MKIAKVSSANLVGMSFTVLIKGTNMNKASLFVAVGVTLSLCQTVLAAQESVSTSQTQPNQTARIEVNIERAIVCHLYWQKGKTLEQLRKLTADSTSVSYELRHGEGNDLWVFLNDYQWKLDLTPIGGDYFGFYVDDFRANAKGDAAESSRDFMESLQREPKITNGVLTLRPEALTVLAFDKPDEQRYKTFTNLVATNLLKSRWLEKAITANKVHGSVVVHIGGFNSQSPWVYYHVEGMPYVGMMLIDPSSGEFIHDDFLSVHETNQETERENMVRAIDENGGKLTLNLPAQQK
jgi:hypothetical protein